MLWLLAIPPPVTVTWRSDPRVGVLHARGAHAHHIVRSNQIDLDGAWIIWIYIHTYPISHRRPMHRASSQTKTRHNWLFLFQPISSCLLHAQASTTPTSTSIIYIYTRSRLGCKSWESSKRRKRMLHACAMILHT